MRMVTCGRIVAVLAIASTLVCGVVAAMPPNEEHVVGPGDVEFKYTSAGKWLGFTPRRSGRSLFERGGLVVFVKDPLGQTIELVNTAADAHGVEVRHVARRSEGDAGGDRAPSFNPDDDRDGRVNEDRVDGVDNDGDGRIDEDFAAIGDDMAISEFVFTSEDGMTQLLFHVECYAWSLPHINGTVLMRVDVQNTGIMALEALRLGPVLEKSGPYRVVDRTFSVAGGARRFSTPARAFVATEPTGVGLAVIAFAAHNDERDGWTCVLSDKISGVDPATLQPVGATTSNHALVGPATTEAREWVEDGRVVFMLSPEVERLLPGESRRFDFALVAGGDAAALDRAITNAIRTYAGDGQAQYLPPPMSLVPRVIWGEYRQLENDKERVAIIFDSDGGDTPVSADDISFFSNVDQRHVEYRDNAGVTEIVLSGELAQAVLANGDRLTLKGRLASGEFFEALLRPDRNNRGSIEADRFWKTPGKLDVQVLNVSPNPFRGMTSIYYEIPSSIEGEDGTRVQLSGPFSTTVKVYNVNGKLVTQLVEQLEFPGDKSVPWAAIDDNGNSVASGVYYIRLQIEQRFITKRITLLK